MHCFCNATVCAVFSRKTYKYVLILVEIWRDIHNDFLTKTVVITTDEQFEEFEEKQKIFEQPEDSWIDVDQFEVTDMPDGYDMDVLTNFLSLSHVIINGERYTYKIRKPTKSGRNMYMSKSIKRAWYCKTDDYLLFRCNSAARMTADKR